MNHALLMRVIDGKANRGKELYHLCWRGNVPLTGSLTNVVCQRLPFNILHYHIGQCSFLLGKGYLKVMNLHNIGMVERGDQLRFAFETDDKMWVLLQIRVQQFDRYVALELRIESFPDFCHATAS